VDTGLHSTSYYVPCSLQPTTHKVFSAKFATARVGMPMARSLGGVQHPSRDRDPHCPRRGPAPARLPHLTAGEGARRRQSRCRGSEDDDGSGTLRGGRWWPPTAAAGSTPGPRSAGPARREPGAARGRPERCGRARPGRRPDSGLANAAPCAAAPRPRGRPPPTTRRPPRAGAAAPTGASPSHAGRRRARRAAATSPSAGP
jgi:hypothetical protein